MLSKGVDFVFLQGGTELVEISFLLEVSAHHFPSGYVKQFANWKMTIEIDRERERVDI